MIGLEDLETRRKTYVWIFPEVYNKKLRHMLPKNLKTLITLGEYLILLVISQKLSLSLLPSTKF